MIVRINYFAALICPPTITIRSTSRALRSTFLSHPTSMTGALARVADDRQHTVVAECVSPNVPCTRNSVWSPSRDVTSNKHES